MAIIRRAKITRNLDLLEKVHINILEWLRYLQECDEAHENKRNFALKKEIERLEKLNLIIFQLFPKLQANIHMGLNKNQKKISGGQ